MLATVVLMFAVCWLPIHLMNLILYFDRAAMQPDTAEQEYLYIAAFFSCHWFSMANSFVNPIIYCFMSDNFRVDLRQLMMTCCSPLAEHASRTLTKRSCSFGGSLRSSTVVMSTAAAGANHLGASSVRRQQRSNGFHASSTVMVPLRTLAHPGQNVNTGAGAGGAAIRVPIYA
ncbi:hypothetical protein HPB52_015039 [Rhipicephalus sanguineus]|uniref:G-protein coupled receptors family 1 profile domain-containing protein n=1 Tax=Rhipicephalus sanguineus TaxID=34632 RepID=A0A9D4YQ11_RHISA|nr:hypothetical protein HPB52_015039 [Rhipicephalus sanguineus]